MAADTRRSAASRARGGEAAPARLRLVAANAQKLDTLLHDRVRLGMVSMLAAQSPLTFVQIRDALDLTDGNLSVHARKLEDAGYVTCTKSHRGRIPVTEYALASEGRRRFEAYVAHMEALIRHSQGGG